MTTAGNLVFQVIQQGGRLVAYTADKGELVLDITTGQTGKHGTADHLHARRQTVRHAARRKSAAAVAMAPDLRAIPGPLPSSANSRKCAGECSRSRRSTRPWRISGSGPVWHAATACLPLDGAWSGGNTAPHFLRMYTYVLDGKATQ